CLAPEQEPNGDRPRALHGATGISVARASGGVVGSKSASPQQNRRASSSIAHEVALPTVTDRTRESGAPSLASTVAGTATSAPPGTPACRPSFAPQQSTVP